SAGGAATRTFHRSPSRPTTAVRPASRETRSRSRVMAAVTYGQAEAGHTAASIPGGHRRPTRRGSGAGADRFPLRRAERRLSDQILVVAHRLQGRAQQRPQSCPELPLVGAQPLDLAPHLLAFRV